MKKEWLTGKTYTPEELINKIMYIDMNHEWSRNNIEHLKKAHENYKTKDIDPFLEQFQDGDKIIYYVSPEDDWMHLCGREGYSIVRDGEIIADLLTSMN